MVSFVETIKEAIGLREAFYLAHSLQIPEEIFESDNQVLVETCRGNIQRGETGTIIKDINAVKAEFESCGVAWTGRDGNVVTHTIATLASHGKLSVAGSITPWWTSIGLN